MLRIDTDTGRVRAHAMLRVLVLAVWVTGGCKSADEVERSRAMESTPLELDPTERHELAEWWYNGRQLLHLSGDARFALYDGGNRYQPASERGRWSQQNYAALWLEPYSGRESRRVRVSIRKIDGRLSLTIGTLAPMHACDQAPQVLEDRLIGAWRGDGGTLRLDAAGRYDVSATAGEPGAAGAATVPPAARLGLRGRWQVVNGTLVLMSDVPGVDPIRIDVAPFGQAGQNAVELRTPAGAYRRAPDA